MVQLDFDIEKIFRRGFFVLALGFLLSFVVVGIFVFRPSEEIFERQEREEKSLASSPLVISLDRAGETISIPLPNLVSELSLSLVLPRPSENSSQDLFLLRLKKGGASRLITLPEKVYFAYDRGLQFREEAGPFWVEFSKKGDGLILASVGLIHSLKMEEERGSFVLRVEESPQRAVTEFVEASPFRLFGEGKWIGPDLFLKKYGNKKSLFRFELGSSEKGEIISLNPNDFLVWKEGRWSFTTSPSSEDGPIAQLVSSDDRSSLFQGWIGDEYVRFSLFFSPPAPLKTKGEDFLSAIRIRSEKQISCMLDRQCFVLRIGDWVLKTENRWKVLRKKEEKESYAQGKLAGELFVFDRIETKGGQKIICGSLFNQIRSHLLPIEIAVHTQGPEAARLSRGKSR